MWARKERTSREQQHRKDFGFHFLLPPGMGGCKRHAVAQQFVFRKT
jgi:hypothetical protein